MAEWLALVLNVKSGSSFSVLVLAVVASWASINKGA